MSTLNLSKKRGSGAHRDDKIIREIISSSPYPIGFLYKNLMLRREMGEYNSLYEIIRIVSIMLKYLASITICDYLKYFDNGEWSSSQVNRVILDYFQDPGPLNAHGVIKSILTEMSERNVVPVIDQQQKLLRDCPPSKIIPDFKGTILDLFTVFFKMEKELDQGGYLYLDPDYNTFNHYYDLLEYLIVLMLPVLKLDLCIPVNDRAYNCFIAKGSSVSPRMIHFQLEKPYLEALHFKPVLLLDQDKALPLYPFIFMKEVDESEKDNRGSIYFLQTVTDEKVTMMDLVERDEVEAEDVNRFIPRVTEKIFKKLRENAPREKRKPLSPIINYDDFLEFHQVFSVGREEQYRELEDFIVSNVGKYGIVTGQVGTGKTAFLSRYVYNHRNEPVIFHFVRQVNGLDEPVILLRSLVGQMMEIMGVFKEGKAEIAIDIDVLRDQFRKMLTDASEYCAKNKSKLVLIVDGVDNARDLNVLFGVLPKDLPDNCVAVFSLALDDTTGEIVINPSAFGGRYQILKGCPLKGMSDEEISEYFKKRNVALKEKSLAKTVPEKTRMATFGGEPLMIRLLVDSVQTGQIDLPGLIRIDRKPEDKKLFEWRDILLEDVFFQKEIFVPLFYPQELPGDSGRYFAFRILGLLVHLQHSVSDTELSTLLKCDIYKVKQYRRLLNKFLIREDGCFSIRHDYMKEFFSHLYSPQDHIRFHSSIIDYYEEINRIEGVARRDCKALTDRALMYLANHYYRLGFYTENFQGLWDLESDDEFRLEQGLRVGVHEVLKSLNLATRAAVEINDIQKLMKFGFLYNDIERGGVKGGLSMIVSQVLEGNFTEAMDLVRKIPDEAFQYKQMLIISWLLARQDDFLNCLEVLDEALLIPGATFTVDDEDLIFKIVETILNLGIAEGLHILKIGIEEERMVRYYSRLADVLKDHQDLILRIATGASMELRRLGNEEIKGKFVKEFAQIIINLEDEIKKRQFFENLVFEARGLDDMGIKITTLTSLSEVINRIDSNRSESLLEEVLHELADLGASSVLRFKLESQVAGVIARLGNENWASKILKNVVSESSKLMLAKDRAEVYQEIAAATVNLQDAGLMADFLEEIFSLSEQLGDASQQTNVLVGISEVLGVSEEHAELLNIYMETYTYTESLPVDLAAKALQRVARNMKVVRDEADYEKIISVIANLLGYLSTPREKSELIMATAEGLASSKFISKDNHYNYLGAIIELSSYISGDDGEMELGETLGSIGRYIAEYGVEEKSEIMRIIFQNTLTLRDPAAKAVVYRKIGENINFYENSSDLEVIIDYVSSAIREIRNPKTKAAALAGMVKGVTRFRNKALRERYIEKLIYQAENLDDGRQAYQVLSAIAGGLLKLGDEDWAINLYEKALSLIPLREEKAPDALGGVMAGLCRGLAKFAKKDWAQEIYHKLVRRLGFIAPEKKKLEVLLGILDGMTALEEKELLNAYCQSLADVVDGFLYNHNKVIAFKGLAHAFYAIGQYKNSQKMWEKLISITTSLDDTEFGNLKALTLAETSINVFNFRDKDYVWLDQAFNTIVQAAGRLSPYYLFDYVEKVFKNVEGLPTSETQTRIIEAAIGLIEGLELPDDKVDCIGAVSRGIDNVKNGSLLKQILDRTVKVTQNFEKGTYRVRAMAILSRNFLNFGMVDWAKKSYSRIEKAYEKKQSSRVQAMLLSEMLKIPFYSDERAWQDSIISFVLDREIGKFQGEDRGRILKNLAAVISNNTGFEWACKTFDRILKMTGDLEKQDTCDVYRYFFHSLSKKGNIETINKYRSQISDPEILNATSKYLADALNAEMDSNLRGALDNFGRLSPEIKLSVLKKIFEKLLENRGSFEKEEFEKYYREFLGMAISQRDALDFVIGKIISYFDNPSQLQGVAVYLGLLDRITPEAEVIEPARVKTPEAVQDIQEAQETVPAQERILPAEKDTADIEAPMELEKVQKPLDQEAVAQRKKLLHRWTPQKARKAAVKKIDPKDEPIHIPEPVVSNTEALTMLGEQAGPSFEEMQSTPDSGFQEEHSMGDSMEVAVMPDASQDKAEYVSDFLKYGHRMLKSQYYKEAIKYFDKSVEQNPDNYRGYLGLAITYYLLREFGRAVEYYLYCRQIASDVDILDKFVKNVPRNTHTWYEFARTLHAAGALEDTMRICDIIKAEGVFFEFAKMVDALKESCMQTRAVQSLTLWDKFSRFSLKIIYAALIIAVILPLSAGFLFICGNFNFTVAQKTGNAMKKSQVVPDQNNYILYSSHYVKAIGWYDKVQPWMVYLPGIYNQVLLKEAICRYKIGHYLLLEKRFAVKEELIEPVISQCLEYRNEAMKEMENLLEQHPQNSDFAYYLGLCYLDYAMDSQQVAMKSRIDGASAFKEAIKYFDMSIQNSTGSDPEHYLMLSIAQIEYYVNYPGNESAAIAFKAIENLKLAESSAKDPRIAVYQLAVVDIFGNPTDAKVARELAEEAIFTQYGIYPNEKEYWTKKLQSFKTKKRKYSL